ncbi:circadian clock-controlled protein daywake [Musca vetustissima]|uniref:circadian clock-controlled protein daywake n=1 Tax=Musca vetustissima TaxID=27455 RepID=UPI002AB62A19|nr:circadian clock-controlled protein daywake [Musca vetustissima]
MISLECDNKGSTKANIHTSWLRTCPRENPNEDKCFRKFFEGCFPALATGIPEIGVNGFEPLHIDQVSVQKGSGNLILAGGFQNLVIRGPSNATVKRAVLDLEKKILNFELEIPLLRIRAKYNLNGHILVLPLVGNGDVRLALKDVKTAVYTKISLRNAPEEVIHIDDMKVTFNVGSMRIHLHNLFNGNEILAASINSFLNQNGNDVIAELRPDLEKGLADIFHGLWNNVFSKIPLKLWLV